MSHWNDRPMGDFRFVRAKQVKKAFKLITGHGEICTKCEYFSRYFESLGFFICESHREKGIFLVRDLINYARCPYFKAK